MEERTGLLEQLVNGHVQTDDMVLKPSARFLFKIQTQSIAINRVLALEIIKKRIKNGSVY